MREEVSLIPRPSEIPELYEEAFPRLFTRAYRTAYRLMNNIQDAEDVAVETLARAFVRWSSVATMSDAWTTRSATNQAIDMLRRKRTSEVVVPNLRDEANDESIRIDVLRGIRKLPKRQREAIAYRYLLDHSEAETARLMNCSTGTVKQHLSRAIASLKLDLTLAEVSK